MIRGHGFVVAALVGSAAFAAAGGAGAGSDRVALPRPEDAGQPAREGWTSEAVSDAVDRQLKKIVVALTDPGARTAERLATLAAEDLRCDGLVPARTEVVFEAATVRVARAAPAGQRRPSRCRGPAGLAGALERLAAVPGDAPAVEPWAKFKIYRVILDGDERATLRAYFHWKGIGRDGVVERTSEWETDWRLSANAEPVLVRATAERHEQVDASGPSGAWLSDATRSVLRDDPALADLLAAGVDTWWGHVDATAGLDPMGHQGLAVGDVDGDGLDDVFVCRTGGFPNRLYVQRDDGTVVDRAAEFGVDWLDRTRGALLIDLDGDDDPDLVATLPGHVRVLENVDGRRFVTRATLREAPNGYSLAAADADGDGDVDVYVTSYYPSTWTLGEIPTPIPYHDAENGGANVFLRNDGDWRFVDATAETGLDVRNRRFSFAATWVDHDDDGDPDLYVVNDFGRNALYRNDGGRFVEIAAEAGVEDLAAGMGATWADYDRDGDEDLHVSNMFSSAGNRIAFQDRFQHDAPESVLAGLRRHARGDSLFANRGDGTFRDVSVEAGITLGRWAWGSLFADLNNDGLDDLLVSNGYLTSDDTGDL